MNKTVILISSLILACIMVISPVTGVVSAYAEDGKVIYDGNAKEFIFAPGSEYSPSDLFLDFKDVMPGDFITQKITVRNDASNEVKVKIYMRALGAHEDSKDFLSGLYLSVAKSTDNDTEYMFESTADQKAGLTDWVCLGTLYSGGEVNLDVNLYVSTELDNTYSNQIGYLDWEFMIEEFPVEDDDPSIPNTGDDYMRVVWSFLIICGAILIIIPIILRRKKEQGGKKSDQQEENL